MTMEINLETLESRAKEIGENSPDYYKSWPKTYLLNLLINREWQPGDLDVLLEGAEDEYCDMALADYSGHLFAIAVTAAHNI